MALKYVVTKRVFGKMLSWNLKHGIIMVFVRKRDWNILFMRSVCLNYFVRMDMLL